MISSHLPQGQSQAFSTFPKVPAHTLTHGHTRPPSSTQYLWAIKHRQGHLEFLAYICEQFAVGQKKTCNTSWSYLWVKYLKDDSKLTRCRPSRASVAHGQDSCASSYTRQYPCFSFASVFLSGHCCFSMFLICLCFPDSSVSKPHILLYSSFFSSELFWR